MSQASFRNQMERLAKLPPAKQNFLIRLFALLIEAAERAAAGRGGAADDAPPAPGGKERGSGARGSSAGPKDS